MYVTLALSGEMGMFDVEKKTWRVVSGAPAPRFQWSARPVSMSK